MPSWFSLFDLRLVGASFVINGKLPGVFARVVRRCVLGLLARTRGAVGFVLVVIGTGCACSPSVAACSPSVVGSCLPATIVSMAFLISLIALVFYFFLNAAGFEATRPLLSSCAVVRSVLGVDSAADINQTTLTCGKLVFLARKNSCFCSGPSLDHYTMHRCRAGPTRGGLLPAGRRPPLCPAAPLGVCSNRNGGREKNGRPTCLDQLCLCGTN